MSSHMSDSNSSLQVDFPISFRLPYGYMSYIFENCFSMFWRDLVYLFWLYFTHIWQPIYNVLSFKHFIWYDLSFCHKPFRSWDVNLWFLFPFTHFFKIVLEIKGCSLFMSVAYTWVFTFLVGERFQSIYHCELSCKTNPIIITYLYQESKLIWRN